MRASWICSLALAVALVATASQSQELRPIRPIPTPRPGSASEARGPVFRPVREEVVRKTVEGLFAAWNTPRLLEFLSPQFYDSARLPDALARLIPRDAVLRILAIEAFDTLQQDVTVVGPEDSLLRIDSTVVARVRSQLEFEDPEVGFQRIEGTNEYVLLVKTVEAR